MCVWGRRRHLPTESDMLALKSALFCADGYYDLGWDIAGMYKSRLYDCEGRQGF